MSINNKFLTASVAVLAVCNLMQMVKPEKTKTVNVFILSSPMATNCTPEDTTSPETQNTSIPCEETPAYQEDLPQEEDDSCERTILEGHAPLREALLCFDYVRRKVPTHHS